MSGSVETVASRAARRRKTRRAYTHIAPALFVVALTTFYPLASALGTSFREWRINETRAPQGFVGADQYTKALTDETLHNSAWVTAQFTVLSVVLSVVLGLVMALILNHPTKLNTLAKTLLILPFAVAPALKGYSWRFMLDPDYGVYDAMIGTVLPFMDGYDWLGSPFGALMVIVLTEVWGWAPLIALMLLGGLASIPPEIRSAAQMDGANAWQEFWRVTFPLLRPLLVIVIFLKAVFSVKMFDQVVTVTDGGPGRATETLNYFVYSQGFNFLDIGYASAVSWILVAVLGALAAAYLVAMARMEAR